MRLQTVRSPEVMGSDPVARATWLLVSCYCADQENGGTIKACRGWKSRVWEQLCGVTKEEIEASPLLLKWAGQDLVVFGYPDDQERIMRAKRDGGSAGGKKRMEHLLKQTELDVLLNDAERVPQGRGRPLKVKSYADIQDTRNDVLDVAAAITGDQTPMGRGFWEKAIAVIGQESFRAQLMTLFGEIQAGEKPKNPAAVLTGRVKKLIGMKGER